MNPSESLAVAASFLPQIAIIDMGLPVIDGYTLGRVRLLDWLVTSARPIPLTRPSSSYIVY